MRWLKWLFRVAWNACFGPEAHTPPRRARRRARPSGPRRYSSLADRTDHCMSGDGPSCGAPLIVMRDKGDAVALTLDAESYAPSDPQLTSPWVIERIPGTIEKSALWIFGCLKRINNLIGEHRSRKGQTPPDIRDLNCAHAAPFETGGHFVLIFSTASSAMF